ncbi:MAG: dTDP-glucose 4,6-dehydratase [Planctomycetota bacterium]|jgi:dTDP-glucose 4,6-dehydratase
MPELRECCRLELAAPRIACFALRMSAPNKIVVTGHLGFIASAFCQNFKDQYEIVGIDFAGWGSLQSNLQPGTTDVRADIADSARMTEVLDEHQPEAIINFAAESHVDRSIDDDLSFWQSNVLGARNLGLEAHKRGIRLVHVSTDEVYGDALEENAAWTETSPISPRNPYSVTKAAAELMLMSYHGTMGLDVVVTRGANTIGPRQFPEKAVPKAVTCFLEGRPFPLFKTPAQRMWMHVNDHVSGIEAALRKGVAGEAYNIAPSEASEAYTHDVIERVQKIVGKGTTEAVEDRKAYDLRYWMEAKKAERDLGWTPTFDLEQTLSDTVGWYLSNTDWLKEANGALAAAK